jgi:hypothetical protein
MLTACQAYRLVVPALVDAGMEVMCARLDSVHVKFRFWRYLLGSLDSNGFKMKGPAVVRHRHKHILYCDLPGLLPSDMSP